MFEVLSSENCRHFTISFSSMIALGVEKETQPLRRRGKIMSPIKVMRTLYSPPYFTTGLAIVKLVSKTFVEEKFVKKSTFSGSLIQFM